MQIYPFIIILTILVYTTNIYISILYYAISLINCILIVKTEKEGEPPSCEDSPSLLFMKYFCAFSSKCISMLSVSLSHIQIQRLFQQL